MSDFFTLSSSLLPRTARVVGFRGTEAISRLYRFDVFVTAPADDIDFELSDVVGTKALLRLDGGAGRLPCFFAGIAGDIELLHDYGGRALLRLVIVPRLAELALSRHSRVFTDMSAIDVIKAVLEDGGITEYETHVGASAVEEHICQYRESDLDFISRWMEREGIRYFFEHGEDGERLILAADAAYPDEPLRTPVRYFPQVAEHRSDLPSSFRSFSSRSSSVPGSVKVRDNDYARPSLKLSGAAPVSSNGSGEMNLHGERFWSPSDGQRLAQIRAQEQITRRDVFHATGARLHLHAGYAFELEDHPRAGFNVRYLVTEAHHYGNQAAGLDHFKKLLGLEQDDLYAVEVSAISAAIQYRPASVTPWPRIYGFEGAVVDGAASSEYAQIDAHGRYSVKFHFDESALKNGKASTLVRMMQPHGGDIEGFHFPLRKGTEVVVSFLGGDPDRPVISGVVPNALTPSPVTSGNYTRNVIQTGGRNRLELEDLAGQQRITLSTPHQNSYLRMGAPNDDHTLIIHTDAATLIDAGEDLDVKVGAAKNETVTDAVTEIYQATKSETVTGDVTETYQSNKTENVTDTVTENYGYNQITNVTGAVIKNYKWVKDENVTSDVTNTYGATKRETVTGAVTEIYQATKAETVTGTVTEIYGGLLHQTLKSGWTVEVTGDVNHTATGTYNIHQKGDQFQRTEGKWWRFFNGPSFDLYALNKGSFVVGGYETIVLGAKIDLIAGLKFEYVLGCQLKLKTGPEWKSFAEMRGKSVPFDAKQAIATLTDSVTELKNTTTSLTSQVMKINQAMGLVIYI